MASALRPDMTRNTGRTMGLFEQLPENACLFLDVDGTLIDLAETPDAVVVPPGLRDDLVGAKHACGGALALVSGRSIAAIDRLFSPLVLPASGVHGAEMRPTSEPANTTSVTAAIPRLATAALDDLVRAFPGTLGENKTYSYAVHYRAVPACAQRLEAALERFLAEHQGLGLTILPGHCVYDLKPSGVDKGSAIRTFLGQPPFAGRTPVFVGDDVTDVPGFLAATSLGGRAYSVGRAFPGVCATFSGPPSVRRWLSGIAEGKEAA